MYLYNHCETTDELSNVHCALIPEYYMYMYYCLRTTVETNKSMSALPLEKENAKIASMSRVHMVCMCVWCTVIIKCNYFPLLFRHHKAYSQFMLHGGKP